MDTLCFRCQKIKYIVGGLTIKGKLTSFLTGVLVTALALALVFTYNDTTYAPLGALTEAYGLEVGHDAASKADAAGV